eukprot:scaffold14259_cov104-Cylindrotheca_fusiformis.AAC.4
MDREDTDNNNYPATISLRHCKRFVRLNAWLWCLDHKWNSLCPLGGMLTIGIGLLWEFTSSDGSPFDPSSCSCVQWASLLNEEEMMIDHLP